MRQPTASRTPQYWLVICSILLVSVFYFGIRAAAVFALAAVTAVLTDFICLFLRNKSYKTKDLGNIASALLLVMMFPATIPYSIVILSTVFAVAVGSHVFGSRGSTVIPPAAVGYLFAVIGWKDEVLRFPEAGEMLSLFGNEDVVRNISLSASANKGQALNAETFDLLLGAVYGPMGTGCLILLIAGILILLLCRDISLLAVLGFLFGNIVAASYTGLTAVQFLCLNMLLFVMLFFAGDTALLPKGAVARLLYGLIAGHLAGYLIVAHHVEYAPLIAVVLCSPLAHALSNMEEKAQASMLVPLTEESGSPAEETAVPAEEAVPQACEEQEAQS